MTTQTTSLKADAKGFLIADSAADIHDLAATMEGVHSDTGAILALLKSSTRAGLLQRQKITNPNGHATQRAAREVPGQASLPASASARARMSADSRGLMARVAPPSERNSRGRFVAGTRQSAADLTPVVKAVDSLTRQQAAQRAEEKRAHTARAGRAGDAPAGAGQLRDSRARFGSGGGAGGGDRDANGGAARALERMKSMFSGVSGSTSDMEKIDPTVEAAKEVAQLASGPLKVVGAVGKMAGRGFMGGRTKDQAVPWYRRMWQELRLSRSQDSEFNLVEMRTLKEIEKKTGNGGASHKELGIAGLLGSLLGKGGGLLMGGAKGLLRRLPLLGALMAGGSALWSLFGGSDDPSLTPEQNRQNRFKGVGSGVGALLGGGLGLFLGPVGAIIGGIIGDQLGGVVGKWLSGFDWTQVGKDISAKWDSGVKEFLAFWQPITAWFSDKLGLAKERTIAAANAANDAIKQATGIDVKESGKKAMAATSRTVDTVVAKGNTALEKLMPGYRHSAKFDGIKGGDGMAKYGSYTDAEAEKIRQLKTSGANTSANLKGGMPKAIQEKIIAEAKAAGLDPDMMLKIAAMESGGNANAVSSTGAIGVYQFTGDTASGVGIKDRFNADQNIAGGMALTKQNIAMLEAKGIPVTAESIYMMHQLGPKAAKEVLVAAKSPDRSIASLTPATQSAIAKNYGAGVSTAAEYVAKNGRALSARADTVIGKSETGYLPTTVGQLPTVAAMPLVAPPTAPAAVPRIATPTVSVPAAPAVQPAAQAAIPVPINSKAPMEVTVTNDQPANQDIRDRRLAMVATGGVWRSF
ncbi:transglycosylase SLT domain-containing protein [Cupriavidus pinatubonensis]|uniref:Membrane-bound lytic murein transglycosylase F n=1 Tax=Cupriavidus pinatubonensis TaxID=248026 RepID=A0ABN7XV24_9BURK|nr:transglycosylase SLT domain-containing protein [Cupriavidus pinatubonensis]CAG9163866.1 Membrane-bound lytic murein transglycosylase F [Cupriavidus pinatubonensis]